MMDSNRWDSSGYFSRDSAYEAEVRGWGPNQYK